MKRLLVSALLVVGCDDRQESSPPPKAAPASKAQVAKARPPAKEAEQPPEPGPAVTKDGTIAGEAELMGTRVTIRVFLDPGRKAKDAGDAMQASLEEMGRIETLMNEWTPDSELSRLNKAAGGEAMTITADLAEVLSRARSIAEKSNGAFDPTFHGVGQLWSFKPGAVPPAAKEVKAHLPLVDWRKLEVDTTKKTARLAKAGMMVGLGAIAKGYAVDRASGVLRERGFDNHVVEAGGDTFASGTKGGKKWRVGIQNPDRKGYPLGVIPSTDRAVVTSGDYERFIQHEGKRYAHIIDPRTGWPLDENKSAQSVTLVAANATDADAFATAVAVLGPQRGMKFIETNNELEAVIVTRDGKLLVSSGLKSDLIGVDQKTGKPITKAAPD